MAIVITKNFNIAVKDFDTIAVKDFDTTKTAGYSNMLVVTELRVSGLSAIP